MCAPEPTQTIVDYFEWLELLGYGDVADELRRNSEAHEDHEVQSDELNEEDDEMAWSELAQTDDEGSTWSDDEDLPSMEDLAGF